MPGNEKKQHKPIASKDLTKKAKLVQKGGSLLCCQYDSKTETLKAIFSSQKEKIEKTEIHNFPKGKIKAKCTACNGSGKICPHAAAAIVHYSSFKTDNKGAPKAVAPKYAGLKHEPLPELIAKTLNAPQAELIINVESDFPHVPSKWERTILSIKIRFGTKDYIGNLSNIRQLHFSKSMAVSLKMIYFSQQATQIIRYLAINSEPEGAKLSLDAEQTAEFFHCLVGYDNFFKGGEHIIVNKEIAEPVLICEEDVDGYILHPTVSINGGHAFEIRKSHHGKIRMLAWGFRRILVDTRIC